jgi:hypothetical protein
MLARRRPGRGYAPQVPAPVHALVLAGGPRAPGAFVLLERMAPARARVLLTGEGLAWLEDASAFFRLHRTAREIVLCSQSARERGLSVDATPSGVRWSSLGTWMVERAGEPFAWLGP